MEGNARGGLSVEGRNFTGMSGGEILGSGSLSLAWGSLPFPFKDVKWR
jgi:hypothetical protein